MTLTIQEDLLQHFLASPLGAFFAVRDLNERPQHPLHAPFRHFLRSIPSDLVEAELQDPEFEAYHGGELPEGPTAAAQELAAIRCLSAVVPARRLAALVDKQPRPLPYNHPALQDLTISDEGMVKLNEFRYDGAVLERKGFSFLPAPATQGPNGGYWLLQHLAHSDLRNTVQLRLDPFMWGPSARFPRMHYKMYLYGRTLNWERLSDLKEPEHGRWMPDKWTHGTTFTDFVWERRDDEVHFRCEELPRRDEVLVRGARYLHAVYDLTTRRITHLDGALRVYDDITLRHRTAAHLRNVGKVGKRVKLFRTDQPLLRERLAGLTVAFFVWNHDVASYFGPATKRALVRSSA